MPPATFAGAPATSAKPSNDTRAASLLVPFSRAAKEHVESFLDVSQAITASTQPIAPVDIPAYGFMRGIYVEVEATGGSGTAAFSADGPFNLLQDVSIQDVNGAPIYGPVDGFDTYLVNRYGGYRKLRDPKLHPDYATSTTGGTFKFLLYIPIEVSARDALGSLGNMNAASSYKLRMAVAPASTVYSTAPTTNPVVRIRAWLDAWTQPGDASLEGHGQATQPPAHGTTSYWSKTSFALNAGQNAPRLPRVGNYVRNLIVVWRTTAGVRTFTGFPDPLTINWDTRVLKELGRPVWRGAMAQRFQATGADEAAGALNTGVLAESYTHDFDGMAGAELRDLWLPTGQSTRLELSGNFGAAGTLTVLTNDVSPAGEMFT